MLSAETNTKASTRSHQTNSYRT